MGKVFKSAKKIVKKAAPVIGMVAANAILPGSGFALAAGAGIGGLAGGYGVKNSLMMGMGGYGLGSLAAGAGLGAAAYAPSSSAIQGVAPFMKAGGAQSGGGFFSGIMSGLKSLPGNIMRGATNFLGGQTPGADPNAYRNLTQSQQMGGTPPYVPGTTPRKDTSKPNLLGGLFNKLNTPLGVLGATTALGYLGAKQKTAGDPVEEAKRMMTQYQSPTDIKYGTKFSSAPGQKVKGLFWNPTTLQYQDQPYVAQSAQGGIINALARGGQPMSIQDFPRKQGHISGPGTATSDSVPALLSDGEFVMTADAVRGIGNGSRREGAKKMYNLMNQFERRAVA